MRRIHVTCCMSTLHAICNDTHTHQSMHATTAVLVLRLVVGVPTELPEPVRCEPCGIRGEIAALLSVVKTVQMCDVNRA